MIINKFLIIVIIVLAGLIGCLIHTIVLQGKELKRVERVSKHILSFTDRVLRNIAIHERINIEKYIAMTNQQDELEKKGGE